MLRGGLAWARALARSKQGFWGAIAIGLIATTALGDPDTEIESRQVPPMIGDNGARVPQQFSWAPFLAGVVVQEWQRQRQQQGPAPGGQDPPVQPPPGGTGSGSPDQGPVAGTPPGTGSGVPAPGESRGPVAGTGGTPSGAAGAERAPAVSQAPAPSGPQGSGWTITGPTGVKGTAGEDPSASPDPEQVFRRPDGTLPQHVTAGDPARDDGSAVPATAGGNGKPPLATLPATLARPSPVDAGADNGDKPGTPAQAAEATTAGAPAARPAGVERIAEAERARESRAGAEEPEGDGVPPRVLGEARVYPSALVTRLDDLTLAAPPGEKSERRRAFGPAFPEGSAEASLAPRADETEAAAAVQEKGSPPGDTIDRRIRPARGVAPAAPRGILSRLSHRAVAWLGARVGGKLTREAFDRRYPIPAPLKPLLAKLLGSQRDPGAPITASLADNGGLVLAFAALALYGLASSLVLPIVIFRRTRRRKKT